MKVNAAARIEIMHSKRGLQVIVKSWSGVGWEWLGPKNPLLPEVLKSLHETGKAEITDESGTAYLKALDPMYI